MTLQDLQPLALDIAKKYKIKNKEDGHKARTLEQYMSSMVGDVGDLQKFIMAKCGYRHYDDVDAKISHELGDVLRCLLVISHELDIDLEQAFVQTMEELKGRLEK